MWILFIVTKQRDVDPSANIKLRKINCCPSSNENRDTCSDSHTQACTKEPFTVNRVVLTFVGYCFLILSCVYLQLGFSYSSVFSFFLFLVSPPSISFCPCNFYSVSSCSPFIAPHFAPSVLFPFPLTLLSSHFLFCPASSAHSRSRAGSF